MFNMSVGPIEKSRSTACLEADEEKVPDLFQYVEPKTSTGTLCHIVYITIF